MARPLKKNFFASSLNFSSKSHSLCFVWKAKFFTRWQRGGWIFVQRRHFIAACQVKMPFKCLTFPAPCSRLCGLFSRIRFVVLNLFSSSTDQRCRFFQLFINLKSKMFLCLQIVGRTFVKRTFVKRRHFIAACQVKMPFKGLTFPAPCSRRCCLFSRIRFVVLNSIFLFNWSTLQICFNFLSI